MSKKPSNTIIQSVPQKAMNLIETMSREQRQAEETYLSTLKRFPVMEQFIRRMPEALWNVAVDCNAWGDQLSITLPWNWEVYNPVAEALKEEGLVMTYEYDPAKHGNKAGSHQFTWKLEGYAYGDPYLTIYLDASREGSKCVLVPLEVKEEVVKRILSYERVCPDGHPELFDEQGNFTGEPFLERKVSNDKPE